MLLHVDAISGQVSFLRKAFRASGSPLSGNKARPGWNQPARNRCGPELRRALIVSNAPLSKGLRYLILQRGSFPPHDLSPASAHGGRTRDWEKGVRPVCCFVPPPFPNLAFRHGYASPTRLRHRDGDSQSICRMHAPQTHAVPSRGGCHAQAHHREGPRRTKIFFHSKRHLCPFLIFSLKKRKEQNIFELLLLFLERGLQSDRLAP